MSVLLKQFKRRDYALLCVSLVFIITQVWLELRLPDYMSEITMLVQTDGSAMADVLSAGGRMLLCALGSLVCAVCTAGLASVLSSGFSSQLRSALFERVERFSLAEINQFSTASLITRSTNDVTQVQMLIVMGLQVVVRAPVMAALAIGKIAGKSGSWTTATAVAVVIQLASVIICISLAQPRFRKLQQLTDDVNRVMREELTGLRVVRAYNAEDYQQGKFEQVNDALTRTQLFAHRVMCFLSPGISLIMSALGLAIYLIGAQLMTSAGIPERVELFADMVVFSQYAMQILSSFMMLVMIFVMLPRASVAAKRIAEVLNTKPTIQNGSAVSGAEGLRGEVELRDVSFRYGDADGDVLEHISFTAHRGETVAIIGATGCGKTTLVDLIPRFYDATGGTVLVDGRDVREYDLHALRSKIGYVSQRATLFGGTVRSNVAFGAGADENGVEAAVRTAQAEPFVTELERTYDAHVAQGGVNLSGGQKQRLSIARALCRESEILIFDDSFSALDYKTDRVLREALERDVHDTTRIIVAQRIGTIRNADRILVLDDGRIVGNGTHDELMQTCRVYQEIAYSQLSKEELA